MFSWIMNPGLGLIGIIIIGILVHFSIRYEKSNHGELSSALRLSRWTAFILGIIASICFCLYFLQDYTNWTSEEKAFVGIIFFALPVVFCVAFLIGYVIGLMLFGLFTIAKQIRTPDSFI